jgi:protein-histidine pros-kinase
MSTSLLNDAIEWAPDVILLVDESGAIVYANASIARLFGYTPADVVGKSIETLLPERLRGRHVGLRTHYSEAPSIRPMGDSGREFVARRRDGTEFPVEIQLAPVGGNAERMTVAAIRDATERHAFQNELRAAQRAAEGVAKLKGEFLGMAAHDLSQPLQTMELLIASLERRMPAGRENAEIFGEAATCLGRMRQLLRMLGEISRAESGVLQIKLEPVSIATIFSDLERQFSAAARAKSLHYASEPCSHVVETDPALLRGMLSNLIGNAIQYTPQGEVRVRCLAPRDGGLQLLVADTGWGIPDDELQPIFDDFHRGDAARRTNREGFGLGLGIVRRFSMLLGLPISVSSTIGAGSTFRITVPPEKVHHRA